MYESIEWHEKRNKFATTIKRKYWNMKMQDVVEHGYFWEYKSNTYYWSKRLTPVYKQRLTGDHIEGVFLVGNEPHRVRITEILAIDANGVPERYRGALATPIAWALKCHLESTVKT